jgi:hypothetical protein
MCVDRFPLSKKREPLMGALEQVHQWLINERIKGELWIDGGFMTEKIDPDDIDIVLCVDGDFFDSASASQRDLIRMVGDNMRRTNRVDSYAFAEYRGNDPRNVGVRSFWENQFGLSRAKTPKGMALISLGGLVP